MIKTDMKKISSRLNLQQNLQQNLRQSFRKSLQQSPVTWLMVAGIIVVSLNGCIAKKDIILPTTTEREMLQAQYRQCITKTTNDTYDNVTPAEEIVRNSFDSCRGARQAMLMSYPRRWHEHMAGKLDQEIFQSELAWINDKRK